MNVTTQTNTGDFYFMNANRVVTKEIKKEYLTALYNAQSGYDSLMQRFKEEHSEELKIINTMGRKRTSLKDSLECLKLLDEPIYWFTLTFNNEKDCNSIKTKRESAQRFLHDICSAYVMVEEFGDLNERYHLHGFLCFKYGYGFLDFTAWHSRQKLVLIDTNKGFNSKVRYLTNYTAKSVPRVRRDKTLSALYKYYLKHKSFSKSFPEVFRNNYAQEVAKYVNPF